MPSRTDMDIDAPTPRHARLGELLAEARRAAGLTQASLARTLGRPQNYCSKYESGRLRLDLVELIEISDAVGCAIPGIVERLRQVEQPAGLRARLRTRRLPRSRARRSPGG